MSQHWGTPELERLERIYAAPQIVEQRAQTRQALAVRSGERGIDIGCGPGFLLAELLLETESVIGLDVSSEILAAAMTRVRRDTSFPARLVQGDIAQLPFADGALDFAVAVQIYLYATDIAAALREVWRVLRPGGRLVLVDTDWESCVWLTSDDERHRRVLDTRVAEFPQPNLPRRLPGLLTQAGFKLMEARAIPILEIGQSALFSLDMIGAATAAALAQGISAVEVEAWAADLRSRLVSGDYFFSVNRYLFLATR